MKAKVTILSLLIATLFITCLSVQGQQTQNASISDLTRQLQELLVLDRDESTPLEVKNINREFIKERRAELRLLLQKRIDALQKYQSTVSAIITPDEKKRVQAAILELQEGLRNLDRDTPVTAGQPLASTQKIVLTIPEPATPELVLPNTPAAKTSTESVPTSSMGLTATASLPSSSSEASPSPQATKTAEDKLDDIKKDKSRLARDIIKDVKGTTGADRLTAAQGQFSPTADPAAYARLLTLNILPREQFTKEIEEARVDEQVGSTSSSAGSTSLVSKGSIPAILGFAVENGGLTRTGQGTSITFRGNLVGLAEALAGKGFIDGYEDDSLTARRLRRFSFGITYDTSLGDTANLFVGNRQQLSSYTFRYEFFNHRDPRDQKYTTKWAELVSDHAQAVANTANLVQNLFRRDPVLKAWLENAQQEVAKADDSQLEAVIKAQFDALEELDLSPSVKLAVTNFSTAFTSYRQKKADLLKIVANSPIFTVEYVNNRRPGLIDTSNLNLVYSTGVAEGKASLTFNGAATIFNSRPAAGMQRLRDFDFSTQLDVPFGDPRGFGQFVLSFSGQYKRLTEDELGPNNMILNTKGDIATGNLKFEIPIKSFGMKLPLSFTFSNRTEFDLKQQFRGNFGFLFDPDILYNLLKPFTTQR